MKTPPLVLLVALAGCAPTRDPETLEQLHRIDDRLGKIEDELAAQRQTPRAPTAAQTAEPTPAANPGETKTSAAPEPTAPGRPAADRASLTGTIRLEGAYAQAGGASVVALTPLGGSHKTPKPGHFTMEQSKKSFVPHVLAVPVGSQVAFPNHDVFFHNVFSLSPTKPFDLGVFDVNKSRDVTFEKPGVVQVNCNLHAMMGAYIVVLDEPRFAIANESGHFALHDLAPGRYHVRIWSERSKRGIERDVDLPVGQTRLQFTVAADAPPQIPPDKHGRARSAGY